jgi:enterochelin esterase-like enzyme
MELFKKAFNVLLGNIRSNDKNIRVKNLNIPSKYLTRGVNVDIFLPPGFKKGHTNYPTLYFNDGQDMLALGMYETLTNMYLANKIPKLIVVAVYASDNRMQEYGVAGIPDYQKRGSLAAQYTNFLLKELIPFVESEYAKPNSHKQRFIAGFSLGGLSAFDIAWQHPNVFAKVGAFSASFWWRSKASTHNTDPDANRIIHDMLKLAKKKQGMKFWFEVGTNDETDDRNNNGIIDSIDDTRDVINLLVDLGYHPHQDIEYVEIDGGEHNQQTWGQVMPEFLIWLFN